MDDLDINTSSKQEPALDQPCLVMLVDDQMMVAEALRRILEPETDMNFHYCNDPGQAVKTAEQIKPSLILLDMVMPEIDGLTVLRFLRSNPLTQDIPVVVLSSKEESIEKAAAFAGGANDYQIKWPDRIELLARIRYHSRWFITLQQRNEAFRALRVSQRKLTEINLQLQQIASLDGLTGIPNRRCFDERLEEEWKRAIREQAWLTLVMLDIDHFKQYNDLYGHLAGDECLKSVASAIAGNMLRPADTAARYGGEEFILVLPGTNLEGGEFVAEKVRSAIEELCIPHEASATGKFITISLGLATTVPGRGSDALELLAETDAALYAAKEAGRNRWVSAPLMKA
jgi:two-component system, chemotaxis family, response regulator WspR